MCVCLLNFFRNFYQFSNSLEHRLAGILSELTRDQGGRRIIIERRMSKRPLAWLLVSGLYYCFIEYIELIVDN